jgi:DNA-binding MarR family transcriptional regulator
MNVQGFPNADMPLADVLAKCACFNVRRAARIVTQYYDEALEPSHLRITQFSLLASLVRLGPSSLTSLADALGMDRTTLTRNLRPLEHAKLIVMDTGVDRRTHLVRLTEQGRQAVKEALPLWKQAQATLVSRFGPERTTALLGELRALVGELQPT